MSISILHGTECSVLPPKLPFRRKATRMRCMGRAPPVHRRLRRKVETFGLPRLAPTGRVSDFQDANGFFPQMHCRFDDIIVRFRKFCKGLREVSWKMGAPQNHCGIWGAIEARLQNSFGRLEPFSHPAVVAQVGCGEGRPPSPRGQRNSSVSLVGAEEVIWRSQGICASGCPVSARYSG